MPGLFLALALLAGCPLGTDDRDSDKDSVPENGNGGGGNGPGSEGHSAPPPPFAPNLLNGPVVSYTPGTYTPLVIFTFGKAVTGTVANWEIAGDGTKTLTAMPNSRTALTPGVLCTFTLIAANAADETKTLAVEARVMPVSGVFDRLTDKAACTITR